MKDLGGEVDEYFSKKYPIETKKALCHKCGAEIEKDVLENYDTMKIHKFLEENYNLE